MFLSLIRIWSRQVLILLWPMIIILLGGGCFFQHCFAFIGDGNGENSTLINHHYFPLSSLNLMMMNQSSWPIDHYDNDDDDHPTNRDNINFFDQINAKNHRPSNFISPAESQSRVAIASPDDENDYDHNYNQKHLNRLHVSAKSTNPNVYYYSPKNYGRLSNHSLSMITSTPGTTIETQQTASQHLNTPDTKSTYSLPSSSVMTSMDKSGKIRFESNDPSSSSSSTSASASSSAGKTLLIHKFYNRDLSQMTAALNKHTGNNVPEIFISSGGLNQNRLSSTGPSKSEQSTMDQDNENITYDDDDEEGDIIHHNDQDGDDQLSPPSSSVTYNYNRYRKLPSDNDRGDSGSSSSAIKGIYRLHNPNSSSSSPRLLRRYYTTGRSQSSSIPVPATVRHMQTSHSHPMPHYYLPSSVLSTHSHGMYDTSLGGHHGSSHHHISLPEKSGTWLGSGLAAGILIGAIPFGIMMASMMPTLFTGSMPIVNTAAVGKRRRRRSILDDWATIIGQQQSTNGRRSISLFDHTTMDKLGVFIRKGITDIIELLNEHHDNYGHDMAKNNHRVPFDRNDGVQQQQQQQQQPKPSYLYSDGNDNDNRSNLLIKTIAKYALAALDEPKCIKEMLCSLMADGRHARTTPWQKTIYLLIKWLPKNFERSIGLDDLFTAVRRNSCLQSYRCPITIHQLNTNQNNNDRHPNNHHHHQRQHHSSSS
ncbi:hypothetical protein DERF_008823 [Dermatophagoides farinae]|uniref:Uncharacterized protein n=1 Tax=Dermatophagoides farinae TaxID=6954 RepID=A0A922L9M0_DERFA|nr:hypothetical protein DERF_008823 [Dermatophagoides farinae]